jgi:hypothetical protein
MPHLAVVLFEDRTAGAIRLVVILRRSALPRQATWRYAGPVAVHKTEALMSLLAAIRRNPVVAGLTMALIVSILAGTFCSVYFAVQAQRAEQSLHDANEQLTARNRELEASRDKLLEQIARAHLSLAERLTRSTEEVAEAEKLLERLANQGAVPKDPSKPR